MTQKDYYNTLEITYTASGEDIRRAFRKLAIKYHPDKNDGDATAEEKFKEIQEAYFILSDYERRHTYHLKSRFPLINKRNAPKPATAHSIYYSCQKLNTQIAEMDIFRMNQEALFDQIMLLISNKNIEIIQTNNNDKLTQQIINELLKSSRPLAFSFVEQINNRLAILAGSNNVVISHIYIHTKNKRQIDFWEKYNGIIILIVTLLLCWLIWVL